MIMKHLLAAACVATVSITSVLAGGEGWTHDFSAAKKQAATEEKDLLIDFTGSDWCGWCIRLNKEVFSHDPFKDGVKDKFVLVELDYPKDKSILSEETIKQNEELQAKYSIKGFPTILLADAEGRPFARTGYQEGGPEKYVAHLDELRAKKGQRDEAFAAAKNEEGVAKAKSLISALDTMDLEDEVVAEFYPEITDEIKAADPKDETGFAAKIAAKQKFAEFEKELNGFGAKQDMEGALAFVEKSANSGEFEGEMKQQVLTIKASILARTGDFDAAIATIGEAQEAAPDSPAAAQLNGFKAQLESAKEKQAAAETKAEADDAE